MAEKATASKTSESTKNTSPPPARKVEVLAPINAPLEQMLQLQQTFGNQAVHRLFRAGKLQAALKIGQPNDIYEQEADQVVRMRSAPPAVQMQNNRSFIQRTCAPCSREYAASAQEQRAVNPANLCPKCAEENKLKIQRKAESANDSGSSVPDDFVSSLGAGQPLDRATREYFEPRFGVDFSHVRIHSGQQAAESASSINALAYTLGNNVVFGGEQYQPGTIQGKRLLAHELAHVVQQKSSLARIQRSTDQVVECLKSGAMACLVHLHGSEEQALQAAKDLYCANCVNLVYINRGNPCRLIQVDVSSGGPTCCADPNRIFDDSAIASQWNYWNKRPGESFDSSWNVPSGACRDPHCLAPAGSRGLTAPQQAIKDYRENRLLPALNRCGNRPSQVGQTATANAGGGPSQTGQSLPFVAFHQNVDTSNTSRSLSIRSYCRGGSEYRATEQGPLTQGAYNVAFNHQCTASTGLPAGPSGTSTGPVTVHNPHIETGQDIDDFVLVTQSADFIEFVRNGRNAVLQSASAPNDGSLSIVLRNERYINIEAQQPARGRAATAALSMATTMGQEALRNVLNGRAVPTNCPPVSGNSAQCPVCSRTAPGSSGTAVPVTSSPSSIQIQRKNLTMTKSDSISDPMAVISGRPALPNVIQRSNPITEADLPSPTERGISRSEQTLRRFMREVYRRQVLLWTAQGAVYLHELLPADVVTLPGAYTVPGRTIQLHRDIELAATNMINDARTVLRGAGASASGTTNVAIRSGYRSATEQFGIWTTWAPQYYRRTMAARRDRTRFPAGEHSDDAAQYLAEYTNERVHSPGYSQHQRGRTIDVSYEDSSGWAPADTSLTWISRWQGSWFFDWLRANAFRYGFFQNPRLNEPWHWEFNEAVADLLRLIQLLLDALEPLIGQVQLWKGGEESQRE